METEVKKVVHPDAEYQQFLNQGQFMLVRSRESGRAVFYPRVVEPGTGSTDLEWVPASGLGVVYSFTTVRPRPPEQPYNVSLIDLAEGPRMMSRVVDVPVDAVRIGQQVKARVEQLNGQPAVVFAPVSGTAVQEAA